LASRHRQENRAGRRIGLALALAALAAPAVAEQKPEGAATARAGRARYRAERAPAAIVVDGNLDESAWSGPPTFELAYEIRPGDNTPARVRTEGWIAYDDRHVYFAFRCHDPEPGRIRARYTDRDNAFADDFVGVVLDTFDDNRRAFEFFVNPLGVQMDLVQDDVNQIEDETWDAIWDSAGRITADGYQVEAAIPYASLRFEANGARGSWGIDAVRIRPRGVREQVALGPRERGRNCYLCQSAELAGIEEARPGRDLEIAPTLTSSRTDERDPFPDGRLEKADESTEPGVTARWGITPDLKLLGTWNPDFSQVEADAAQLSVNNQFALFFPEKRPFFLEGADTFDTTIDAVYTRNIADPDWGLKLTGKQGAGALGLIVAGDEVTNLLLPSHEGSDLARIDGGNTAAVARYRRDVLGNSTVGALYAGREGDDYFNRVLGFDSSFRLGERHTLKAEALLSRTEYPGEVAGELGQELGELGGHAIALRYNYSSRHWFAYANYDDRGEDFRADLGFVPQVDFRKGLVGVERTWHGEAGDALQRIWLGADYDESYRQNGDRFERELEGWWSFQGPLQSFVNVRPGWRQSTFRDVEFDESWLYLFAEANPTSWLYVNLETQAGSTVDYANVEAGDEVFVSTLARFRPGRHLQLQIQQTRHELDRDEGRLFRADLTEIRATWQFNLRTFVRWVGQRIAVDRDPALYLDEVEAESRDLANQLLFAYKINPQTVVFAGYSDTLRDDPADDLVRDSRTFFVKLGYAWRG
jgi:hypothetical protein